mmetsp:Transcript_24165/g.43725  ORF Transcript_24165/g.43725 Transcript_24165/m.43725 type:complete len:276 (+) Transcript_24165:109-936(+)|eukprot:CAMPEP_0196143158 /NCGR_PEP_ID=MMETSP0910-20130528/12749_1 /TAXON_ID=49265 /ORGANISM="Thalassiosira rotula, Strain GSO102" /LENGTH=275 /DNA_ID=CAMNT_0041404567 /DNA_START=92 /DNA_END=919 /DNA_ORIENTATION=+
MMNVSNLLVAACALVSSSAVLGFQMTPSPSYSRPSSLSHQAESRLPHSSAIMPKNSRSQGSLLRVATAMDDDKSLDDAMIRQIDRKIQNYEKKQEAYTAKLDAAKAELEKFQAAKNRYLEGLTIGGEGASDTSFSETTARSLVKSMMWRVIAGSVTFFTSLRFSGSMSTALSIVGSDFFSKAATMFIGERLMNKSGAGRKSGADGVGRSLAKALLWRLFAICNTLTMSWLIAKDLSMASKIAGSDAVFKTGLMFFYERAWAKIEWGKEYSIEFSI